MARTPEQIADDLISEIEAPLVIGDALRQYVAEHMVALERLKRVVDEVYGGRVAE